MIKIAYNETYVADDLDDITIDGISKVGIGVVAFATLFGLAIVALMGLAVWKRFR